MKHVDTTMLAQEMDLEALRTKLATLGPHQVLGHYAYRGLNRIFPVDLYRAFCLTPGDVRLETLPPDDVRCERLDPAALLRETAVPGNGLVASEVETSLAEGEECFGVFVKGVLASHAWYASRAARLREGINVRFDSRYAYSRWAFTRPEYRGRGLHAIGKKYALAHYLAAGKAGVLSSVSVVSFESLNSAARLGSRPVGLMFAATFASRSFLWVSAGCRPYGIELEVEVVPPH